MYLSKLSNVVWVDKTGKCGNELVGNCPDWDDGTRNPDWLNFLIFLKRKRGWKFFSFFLICSLRNTTKWWNQRNLPHLFWVQCKIIKAKAKTGSIFFFSFDLKKRNGKKFHDLFWAQNNPWAMGDHFLISNETVLDFDIFDDSFRVQSTREGGGLWEASWGGRRTTLWLTNFVFANWAYLSKLT